jgi:hypothetical protein
MIGKPSSPVRREAARKRTNPTLVPRCAADQSSWLAGCRRLHRRYKRKAEHFLGFVGIAAALIIYRRLTN